MRPAGYSSDDYSDDDDMDYYSKKKNKTPPIELTKEEKQAKLLRTLSDCVTKGNVEETLKLIDDNSLPIDVKLDQNWTPLLLAASSGHSALSIALIDRGANINQSKDGNTVLMHACNVSQYNPHFDQVIDIVKHLVEKKVNVNVINKTRMTAFLCAASNGNVEVVQYLIVYCDKNAVDNQGWNALFFAVNDNHIELVRYLLDVGMDYKKHDVRRNTVLDYAKQRGFNTICNLIPDHERKTKQYESYLCEQDYYTELIDNPRFMRDVNVMLVGMQCGNLLERFNDEPAMNLFSFLTLNKDDLVARDIYKPYQQNRILGGLYRFHKHSYNYKSIPRVDKNKMLTTYDVGFTMVSALRHYVTMRASLRYLKLNSTDWGDDVLKQLAEVEKCLTISRVLAKRLQRKTIEWEKSNVKVDQITYPEKKARNKIIVAIPIVTAVTIVLYFKFHL